MDVLKYYEIFDALLNTDVSIPCRYSRRKRYSETDWAHIHAESVVMWIQRRRSDYHEGPPHQERDFTEYLRWLHGVSRLRLRPSLDQVPIGEVDEDDDDDDLGPDDYDFHTRTGVHPERGPLQDYMVHSHFFLIKI